jgi:hypothetical protein
LPYLYVDGLTVFVPFARCFWPADYISPVKIFVNLGEVEKKKPYVMIFDTTTMFQNFMMKAMLKKQMKGLSEAQQESIFAAIEKNPDLFMKIATDVKDSMARGMSQQDALTQAMQQHGEVLKSALGGFQGPTLK